jgi:enoyl-CoA hydratase/carnithine racemase
MPFWKIDKCIRKYVGPNPYRAHDVIGPGANFLTWSCLHHLSEKYGEVFKPAEELNRRKDSGETWYSSNRPIVDWQLEDDEEFQILVLGALFQMTGLVLKEKRGQLSYINAIGELCAQFTKGILALMRGMGPERVIELVQKYHKLHPEASQKSWYPEVFEGMDSPEWGQLYVNAEHNGEVGIITISREALNWEVIEELNRAIDWLKMEGIQRVILTGDFHLSTQMIGADTTEFFPALEKEEVGKKVSLQWSQTARRFYDEFEVSVGFIQGKRGLGGMLELMMHCHYLISVDDAQLGMPEVTLPVVPGMEGCHWALRKASRSDYPKLIDLLLSGKSLSAKETVPWLADYSGTMEQALKMAWKIVSGKEFDIKPRKVAEPQLDIADCLSRAGEKYKFTPAQKAIFDCIKASCSVPLSQAIEVQARHSAGFMLSRSCQKGVIGRNFEKIGKI